MNLTPTLTLIFKLCFLRFIAAGEKAVLKDQKTITARSGRNTTLPCRSPNNNIIVVEWSRADLRTEYVLLYRDGQLAPEEQHPSFKNRVDLQDRRMQDGEVSLILKDVTINDEGTYECRVVQRRTNRWKRAHLKSSPISIIYLRVAPPGPTGGTTEDGGKEDGGKEDGGKEDGGKEDGGKEGSVRLRVGLSVSALLLLVAVVGFLISRKCKEQSQSSHQPADISTL